MKIAKQGWSMRSSTRGKRPRPSIQFSAREARLIHRMARNSPEENRRLGRFISRQRHCIRNKLGIIRRYARQIAQLSSEQRQSIRDLQNSPFYQGLGSVTALQPNDLKEYEDLNEFVWLFGEDEAWAA